MPGGVHERAAALELAEGRLERVPRRVADAGVVDRAVRGIRRRQLDGHVDRRARRPARAPRGDDDGVDVQGTVSRCRWPWPQRTRGRPRCPLEFRLMTTDQPQPAQPSRRPRVAIVFGGRSSEHAVSCATAAGVLRAIDRSKYDIVPIGISRDGQWVLAADDPARFELTAGRTPGGRVERRPRRAAALDPRDLADRRSRRGSRRRSSARSTSSSRCCTGPSARTARSRASSRCRTCATSAPACSPPPRAWTSTT